MLLVVLFWVIGEGAGRKTRITLIIMNNFPSPCSACVVETRLVKMERPTVSQ